MSGGDLGASGPCSWPQGSPPVTWPRCSASISKLILPAGGSVTAIRGATKAKAKLRASGFKTRNEIMDFHSRKLVFIEGPEGVAVELTAPDGSTWSFGEGEQRVTGPAVEFCLVGTQRRHPSDTSLVATGPLALEWLAIAQAFAGPAGEGRAPLGERS